MRQCCKSIAQKLPANWNAASFKASHHRANQWTRNLDLNWDKFAAGRSGAGSQHLPAVEHRATYGISNTLPTHNIGGLQLRFNYRKFYLSLDKIGHLTLLCSTLFETLHFQNAVLFQTKSPMSTFSISGDRISSHTRALRSWTLCQKWSFDLSPWAHKLRRRHDLSVRRSQQYPWWRQSGNLWNCNQRTEKYFTNQPQILLHWLRWKFLENIYSSNKAFLDLPLLHFIYY